MDQDQLFHRASRWAANLPMGGEEATAATWASVLLDRVSGPVRVAVTGRPGIGSTSLAAALSGAVASGLSGLPGELAGADATAVPFPGQPAGADIVVLLCHRLTDADRALLATSSAPVVVAHPRLRPGTGVRVDSLLAALAADPDENWADRADRWPRMAEALAGDGGFGVPGRAALVAELGIGTVAGEDLAQAVRRLSGLDGLLSELALRAQPETMGSVRRLRLRSGLEEMACALPSVRDAVEELLWAS